MNTTVHPFAPEEIMAFVDGELSADRAQSISAHIDQCAECAQLAAQVRSASQVLTKWRVDAPSASVQEHVLSATSNSTSLFVQSQNLLARLRVLFSKPLAWAVTSLALLLVAVSTQLFSLRPKSPMFMATPKYRSVLENPRTSTPSPRSVPSAVLDSSESTKLPRPDDKASNAFLFSSADSSAPPSVDRTAMTQNIERVGASGLQLPPMIARTVSLSIVVKDFDAARASLDIILTRHNGYAAELNAATPQGAARTIQASLRIPAPQLVAAVAELKALGRVEAETQNGEEVTQQHADLVARLKNSRETEQRLQDVLRNRTGKVKDVLEVEQEIERVRGEIEQMEAEQKNLEHRVDFATIDLKLAEEYKAQLSSPAPSVGMQLRNATVNGFRNASESLLGILLFFAESGPTMLLWLLVLLFPARLLWKRYKRQLAMS
jgi:hypothetical protein